MVRPAEVDKTRRRKYKFSSMLKQEGCQEVYNLAFNFCHPAYKRVFASISMNRAVVYELADDGGISPLQTYVDENKEENYYALSWARDREYGTPLLVIAGLNGVVRVLDCHAMDNPRTLKGHGNAINDLKTSPTHPSLVLSASKDESVRLWNLQTGVCVAIFAGYAGHRNEVLSCGFHPSGNFIISSGMDNSVKMWSLQGKVHELINLSFVWDEGRHGPGASFPTLYEQYPAFSSAEIHTNYVDCAQYFGDAVLSKSIESKIVLWVRDDLQSAAWNPWARATQEIQPPTSSSTSMFAAATGVTSAPSSLTMTIKGEIGRDSNERPTSPSHFYPSPLPPYPPPLSSSCGTGGGVSGRGEGEHGVGRQGDREEDGGEDGGENGGEDGGEGGSEGGGEDVGEIGVRDGGEVELRGGGGRRGGRGGIKGGGRGGMRRGENEGHASVKDTLQLQPLLQPHDHPLSTQPGPLASIAAESAVAPHHEDHGVLLGIPLEKRKDQIRIIREFNYDRSDIWFLRFSMDFFMGLLAVGNRDGKIFVWDMRTIERPALLQKISHTSCHSACRQAALSFDGSTIISAHDDGSIWRWDDRDDHN